MDRIIIGLVGPIASGKSVISDYLNQQGFVVEKLSDRVREEAKHQGLELTRENLQEVGNYLRSKYGHHILAELTISSTEEDRFLCIDGVRNPGEVEYIHQSGGIIIAITAPEELRLARYLERSKERLEDSPSIEDFIRQNNRDLGIGESDSGQQVQKCINMADLVITNDKDKERLLESFVELLESKTRFNLEGRPKKTENVE